MSKESKSELPRHQSPSKVNTYETPKTTGITNQIADIRSRSVSPGRKHPVPTPKNSDSLPSEGSARPPRHQSISSRIRGQSTNNSTSTTSTPRSSPTPQSNSNQTSPANSQNITPIRIDTSDECLQPAIFRREIIKKSATWTASSQDSPMDEPISSTQEVLDALVKAPVADRVNAKLAAKQFEALVKQFEGDPSRNSSPQSRNKEKLLLNTSTAICEPPIDGELSPGPNRLKRMTSFARRTPTSPYEKNYTESVWLRERNDSSDSSTTVEGSIEKLRTPTCKYFSFSLVTRHLISY